MSSHTGFTNSNIYQYFLKNKWVFTIVACVAAGAAVFFSSPSFIPPKFISRSVMYPSNLISYGSETPTEQLLQLFQSSNIKDSLIRNFRLPSHYDIDTSKSGGHYKLFKQLKENIEVGKTSYESVEIEILDTDPRIAKNMVEEMIRQVNLKARHLQRDKSMEVLKIRKIMLDNKADQIDSLENRIKKLSVKYGLLDYPLQSKEVMEGYMNFLLENKKGDFETAENLYENLQQQGKHFHDLQYLLALERGTYNDLLVKYENSLKDVTKELTYTNIIVHPREADKKSYPIRWLIVVIAVISSLLFTGVILLLFKNRANYKS